MKTKLIIGSAVKCVLLVAACMALSSRLSAADEKTALELVQEGNRHVGEDAKGKVVQIRSEKSIGTLVPNIWYVVYYDPDATARATEVKFIAGTKASVKRPARVFEPITGAHKALDRDKIKTDSDKAIQIATAEPVLKNIKVLATRLTLEKWEDMPVWKVRLWAAKLRNPAKDADIGEVIISAADGKVVKNDLHIDRVD